MVCAAVLVLLGIVLGTALLTDNMGEHIATTTAQEVPDVLSHPFSVVVQIPQISTGSTPSLVVATTTPVATKGAPITAPPRSSSTAQPSTHHIPEGVGKQQQLVCIMGEGFTTVHQLPQDEVCDYIFYDSLYKNGTHNLLSDPSTYSEGLNVFLNNRRGYRHTTLGIGLAFDFLAKANEDLQYAKNPSPLERFWKRSIFHAGILDTPMQPTRNDTRSAIKILERIKRLVDIRRGVTAITAISLPHPNIAWAASFAEDFRALRFTPSIVISIGHYRRADDKHSVCAIMPPTRHPDDIPSERILRAYDFDLSTPITLLSWLYSNGTDTKGVVSVTLKGRWTRPVNFRNTGFYGACSSVDIPFGSYTEVCPSGGPMSTAPLNYSTKHHAMITYISKIRRTFTYDDERAFAEKLCRVKALRTDVPFGIAVYDVDYDDYYNSCYTLNLYRAYSRLKALRKVVNYFKKETAPFNEAACRTFVTG
ncbi:uncharacterized protein LOC142766839 [Rhipicephalus microplus]|uniref:uncharacterized protein LOC142766839 n=1 Tax=Rhipicephalus microplus TaxID=6941 RepID=UPI003F6BE588